MASDTKDTTPEEYVHRIKVNLKVLTKRLSCIQEIVGIMYQNDKLTEEDKEQIYKYFASNELCSASEKLFKIVMSRPIEVYNCFLDALLKTNQRNLYRILVDENKSISAEENSLPDNPIRDHYTWLTEKLDLDNGLLPLLYEKKVLTISEFEKIGAEKSMKNERFLSIIGRKWPDNDVIIKQALEETGQPHICKRLSQRKLLAKEPASVDTQIQVKEKQNHIQLNTCHYPKTKGSKIEKIRKRMEKDTKNPGEDPYVTEISIKVMSLDSKAISDVVIQQCNKQALQEISLAKKQCSQAKEDYNKLHMELDQSREALKRTRRLNKDLVLATNKDDARLKESYEQMAKGSKLIQVVSTKAAKENNRAIWGVTNLDNIMYVVSRWTPEVEAFETVEFTLIDRYRLDGLDNPGDIRASVKGKHLFIMDATRPAKAKKIFRVEVNGMKVAVDWEIGEHEAILSVTEESNVIATVYANHQLVEYTYEGEEVHRIDLSNTGMMHPWHTVKLTNGQFLVCHGHYDEPVHSICEIDNNGQILRSYADAGNVHNLDVPMNLAVDKFGSIIVADYRNGLVLLLSSDLKDKKVLLSKEFGIRRPARLLLDEESGRLIIADNKSGWQNGRVLVFKIKLVD